jgi:Tol biopolymer transport system component
VFSGYGGQRNDFEWDMNPPDKNTLYMQDLRTGVKLKVFELMNGSLHNYSLAPSGTSIAVQANYEMDAHLNPRLVVLTAEGKEITAFSSTHDFAWSPDGRFLAYTTGISDHGEVLGTGTWLYDQQLRSTRKIYDKGNFVAWSPTDHNLYIWTWPFSVTNQHVFRFHPRNQTLIATNLKGIFFSPTGRYYHTGFPRYNEGRVEVYDAQSSQPLLSHRPRIARVLPNARIVGWASDTDVLILEVYNQGPMAQEHPQGRIDTVIYDVTNDIARIIRDDAVIGWQNGQVIVHNRGKFSKRALALFPLLPDQTEEPSPASPSSPY